MPAAGHTNAAAAGLAEQVAGPARVEERAVLVVPRIRNQLAESASPRDRYGYSGTSHPVGFLRFMGRCHTGDWSFRCQISNVAV